ncbi:uncharacterized protein KQ657_003763 [Scheffersomyces spartinae]|uniref:OTU domain-containing protein n=1 Tax=Scheffersomyces spartinae TaxID=45513 RepID=A0A9P7VC97_9ASCO|nr:uncharacterized protein KQ657_003763 [Scheffersomyces spartinae]KAG7195237.1 hypothetical protein KQ657_003763 [Scheffersomyces spartinae]
MDELLAKHKKENRDLIATTTGLKKQATKKTRKSVLQKCEEMEKSLLKRQQKEIRELENPDESSETTSAAIEEDEELTPEMLLQQMEATTISQVTPEEKSSDQRKPKRNRQKERLAKRKEQLEQIREEAIKEAEGMIDYRAIEIESMAKILAINNLKLHEIKPDGHCLFASIQDQLQLRHQLLTTVDELRKMSGTYILDNRNDFIPFMFNEKTSTLDDLDEYVERLTTTPMWGSDVEILAIARIYDCPISIFSAGLSTIKMNEDGQKPELKLGYYKHSYGLGEHYNSLRDINA